MFHLYAYDPFLGRVRRIFPGDRIDASRARPMAQALCRSWQTAVLIVYARTNTALVVYRPGQIGASTS